MKVAVISWPGCHQKASAIYSALSTEYPCRIIFSDASPNPFPPGVQTDHRPETSFWADKFEAAVRWGTSSDLLVVHADCSASDWSRLSRACEEAFVQHEALGAWCPLILGTPWTLTRTEIGRVGETTLRKVAQTDGLVFALRKEVVSRMAEVDYSGNRFGWGIDWMFNAHIHSRGWFSAVETSVRVRHLPGAGYSRGEAGDQMKGFLKHLSPEELRSYAWLTDCVRKQ